jgi:Acetyltransferase (GNAT) family
MAAPQDEDGLRALARQASMPGDIRVAYAREPGFFDSLAVHGRLNQVIAGHALDTGKVVGMGLRSLKDALINGSATGIGYLSGLRLLPPYRGAGAFVQGLRLLRQLHADARAHVYLTTVLETNQAARSLLESGRLGLPVYRDQGLFRCLAMGFGRTSRFKADVPPGCEIRCAGAEDIPEMVAFWNREGTRRQFFPCYTEDDLAHGRALLTGLRINDVLLAVTADGIQGTAAAWDQTGFRQSVVTGYAPRLRAVRPFYNLFARLRGAPRLARPGSVLPCRTLALMVVKDDALNLGEALLSALVARNRQRCGFFMAGMHARDPLLPVLLRRPSLTYNARLYVVHWPHEEKCYAALDNRVPYLELGAL